MAANTNKKAEEQAQTAEAKEREEQERLAVEAEGREHDGEPPVTTREALEATGDSDVVLVARGATLTSSPIPALPDHVVEASDLAAIQAIRSEAGRPFVAPLVEPREEPDDEIRRAPIRRSGRDPLDELRHQIMAPDPDDYEKVGDRATAPGQTERGWSPEVTARHPRMIAATLDEMGASAPRRASLEGIDPNDRVALEDALREQGFHEVRVQDAINKAARVNAERLAAADELRATASPAGQAALGDAMDTIREQAALQGNNDRFNNNNR